MDFVIGIDVGTQSTKGVLIGPDGRVRAVASAQHRVSFPQAAWAEQDPMDWIEATREVLAELSSRAGGGIGYIAVDAQVDGVVATDKDLNPLHPAVIWMDRRASAQATLLEESVGGDRVFEVTGLNADSSHGAPKMMWLLDNLEVEPAHLLPPASFVTGYLCGHLAQDHANASSSMLYDVAARDWSEPLLDASGIDPGLLPPVVESTTDLGQVRPHVATELGLPPGWRVVAGTGDDHAAAVGAGAALPGVVADVTGTAEPVGVASLSPVFDPDHLVETHAHAVPGSWFIENPGFVSGGSVLWASEMLGVDQAAVLALAAESPAGSNGLLFMPALSGAMAPRWNDHARGSITGASMDHGRAHLARAVLEGCAFALRDIVDRLRDIGLAADRLHVTGGGARSPLWLQMKADVTGREVLAVEGEGAAVGAACLAAVAAGWFADVPAAASAFVDLGGRTYDPDSTRTAVYQEGYERYRATYDALEPTYRP